MEYVAIKILICKRPRYYPAARAVRTRHTVEIMDFELSGEPGVAGHKRCAKK